MAPTLHTVDLAVPDLDAAVAFYAKLGLGFKIDEYTKEHADCTLPSGFTIMLDTDGLRAQSTKNWEPPTSGRSFLTFEYASPQEVDLAYEELTKAGAPSLQEPFDAFWGMRYATIADPGGNGVDLYAVLPTSTD